MQEDHSQSSQGQDSGATADIESLVFGEPREYMEPSFCGGLVQPKDCAATNEGLRALTLQSLGQGCLRALFKEPLLPPSNWV